MLLGIISFLAAAAGAAACLLTEAFYSYTWLWLLPAVYCGSFLALTVLAVIVLIVACTAVNKEKSRGSDSPVFRRMALWYIEAGIALLRVRIHTEGLEKTPRQGRFLLVCNHLHEVDPAILMHLFPKSQLAFVSKQENKKLFLVGGAMAKLLCPLINREDDRQALKTILRCVRLLKSDTVNIAVFPEGYICPQRKLQHFRPGVFKIAQRAGVPIVVCTLRDTQHVVKNFLHLRASDVSMHLLDVIPPEELEGKTTTQVAQRVYRMMADDLGPENVLEENT